MKILTRLCLLCMLISSQLIAQNALNFDGSNDYVQTTFAGVTGTTPRTFEAWIYVNAGAASTNLCIMDFGANMVGSRNTFAVGGNRNLQFLSGGTNANIGSGANSVPVGQWAHVAFIYNGTMGFLYVNGVQVGTGSLTTVNTQVGNQNLRIGERVPGGSINFNGIIDEVRVWNVARTINQLNTFKNAEFCGPQPNLVAYYKLNNGIAGGINAGTNTAIDYSGNNNNGVLTSFSLSGTTSNWVAGNSSITSGSIQGGTSTLIACVPHLLPSGKTINATSLVTDTALNAFGCDSIYSVNFTALSNATSSFSTTVCDGYYGPSGRFYSTSGNHVDTLSSTNGCDSLISIGLTVNSSKIDIQNITACKSYVSPLGNTYTTNGNYFDTLTASAGCDSVVVTSLILTSDYLNNSSPFACDAFTTVLGNTITTSGTYTDTIYSGTGCDSIYNYNLTVGYSSSSSMSGLACSIDYISSLGNVYDSTGVYTEYTTNKAGCDSVISLTVKIEENKFLQTRDTVCRERVSPSGQSIWNSTGWYSDTIPTKIGCDSVIQMYVVINNVDTQVEKQGNKLVSEQTGVNYQWINCNVFTLIAGATSRSYIPTESGSYAVIVDDGVCRDTSVCFVVNVVGIDVYGSNNQLRVFPNPTSGVVSIQTNQNIENVQLVNTLGEVIKMNIGDFQEFNLNSIADGVYIIKVRFDSGQVIQRKLVLKR